MGTVGQLVDRTIRDWLYPPDDQPTRFSVPGPISTTAATFTYDPSMLQAEEELLLGPGRLIEVGLEQMTVTAVNIDSNTLTVRRGANGTPVTAHDAGSDVFLSPPFSRHSVLDGLASAVVSLYPRLYWRRATQITVLNGYTPVPADAEIPESFTYIDSGYPCSGTIRFIDLVQASTTRAMLTLDVPSGVLGTLVYRARFSRPTGEHQDLEHDCGVLPEYETAVQVRALAHLVAGRDMSRTTTEYLTRQLEAQIQQETDGGRLREGLLRYYEYLMDELQRQTTAVPFRHGWVR